MAKKITRRKFISGAAALLASGPFVNTSFPKERKDKKSPNLLIVFPDQMRAHAQGFMNQDPVITPTLDRFSRESVVFSQAVSNYPVCSPFRAMLLTGKYPHSNGVLGNCYNDGRKNGYELREGERCWSDILKERGYSLGYIGKWHLENPHRPYIKCKNNSDEFAWNEWTPPNRRHGFDYWYAYNTYDYHMRPMYWDTNAPRDGAHWVDQWGPEHEADKAISFLKNEGGAYRDSDKPFALVVSMNPPHMPYSAVPDKYVRRYAGKSLDELCNRDDIPAADKKWGKYYRKNVRHYFAMVTGVDEQFGRILDALESLQLDRNTIVLFTSDHGNCLGVHDEISKPALWEEAMRVPFMIRWPGKIKPRMDDLLISSPDIFPTLLDLMGFGDDIPEDVEGISHASLILNGVGFRPSSQLYMTTRYNMHSWGERGVRTHRYTMVINKMPDKPDNVVLFDNITDEYQMHNLADENPEIVKKLVDEELIPWLRKTKDPWLKHLEK